MKVLNRSFERLKVTVGDATRQDSNLALLDEMERAAVIAKMQPLPKKVLDKAADDAARNRLSLTFRNDLVGLMRELLEVEHAVIQGRFDVAKSHLAEVEKLRDKAHAALGVDEDEKR